MLRTSALPNRAGRMTATMRAVTVVDNRPKVLRIAVLESGRIALEKIVREQRVTVGEREDSHVVVAGARESFVRERDGWHLRLGPTATARVASKNGIFDVPAGTDVRLDDDARGKVVLGKTTLLFQLVAPPPIATTPKLPLGVVGGLADRIDWNLTLVAAISFLAHFGLVGSMYSDWMDPTIATGHEVSGVVDLVRNLPPELPIEQKSIAEGTATPTKPSDTTKPTNPSSPTNANTRTTNNRPPTNTVSDRNAQLMADRADAIMVGLVAAKDAGPAVKGALDRSEIPAVDLTSAAQSQAAAAHDGSDVKVAKGDPLAAHSKDLSALAPGAKADANHKAGDEGTKPPPPVANLTLQNPSASMPISDADVVVAGLRNRFRKCYQDGLEGDPTMQGKATLVATVAPNGEVQSVSVADNNGLSPKVTACSAAAVQRATFKGNGGVTTVRIPISFFHQ